MLKQPFTSTNQPFVTILGTDSLALFLAIRLQNAGSRVSFLLPPKDCRAFSATEFSLKEERAILHHKNRFKASWQMNEQPDLLIIAAAPTRLRSLIPLVNPALLTDTPVLNFTSFADTSYLNLCLKPVIPCYFEGFINHDKNHLNLLSRQNLISVSLSPAEQTSQVIERIFSTASLALRFEADYAANFWAHFIPFAAGCFLTTLTGKNFYQITKEERHRRTAETIIEELADLAVASGTELDRSELLRKLYNVPSAYLYTNQQLSSAEAAAEIARLDNYISREAELHKTDLPGLRKLWIAIYNKMLA